MILPLNDPLHPHILVIEKDFLLAYKPPGIHSAPLVRSSGETLLDWCVSRYPEIAKLPGRKPGEGGLLHRLDYETQGLILIARTAAGMESLLAQQKEKKIIKGYSALAAKSKITLPGFPPGIFPGDTDSLIDEEEKTPLRIRSAFRPYGPGRKAVRPVTDNSFRKDSGDQYLTEITGKKKLPLDLFSFQIRIVRGFRHQIRCHLAWLGSPIVNDSLYGGSVYGKGFLGLRACMLSFRDPSSGEEKLYTIPSLEPE